MPPAAGRGLAAQLPSVLIVGDSISHGYFPVLVAALNGTVARLQHAPSNTGASSLQCYLVSKLNRARFWIHAGNHIEPEEEIRNRAYFHARDSDLPQKAGTRSGAVQDGYTR